jgi:hypothetical protein
MLYNIAKNYSEFLANKSSIEDFEQLFKTKDISDTKDKRRAKITLRPNISVFNSQNCFFCLFGPLCRLCPFELLLFCDFFFGFFGVFFCTWNHVRNCCLQYFNFRAIIHLQDYGLLLHA